MVKSPENLTTRLWSTGLAIKSQGRSNCTGAPRKNRSR